MANFYLLAALFCVHLRLNCYSKKYAHQWQFILPTAKR